MINNKKLEGKNLATYKKKMTMMDNSRLLIIYQKWESYKK